MSIGIHCLREFSFIFFFGGQPGHNYPTLRVPDGALGGHWHPDHALLCCVFILKVWHYRDIVPQTPICNRLLCLIDRSSDAWNR